MKGIQFPPISLAGGRGWGTGVVRWLRRYASWLLAWLLLLTVASPAPAATGKLAATPDFSIALHNDGTVWTWGQIVGWRYEQTIGTLTPARVPGLTGIVAVAAAGRTMFALKDDGTVWGWGWGFDSYLLRNTEGVPTRISGLTGVVSIAVGPSHALAVKNDGTVWGWGECYSGQLGNGCTSYSRDPLRIEGVADVIAVAVGDKHSIALRSDGTVWSWGSNNNGALGTGAPPADGYAAPNSYFCNVPVRVQGVSGVTAIAAAGSQGFALKADGTLWGWGNNSLGQLGDGTKITRDYPVRAAAIPGAVAALAPSPDNTVALMADGTVRFWGRREMVYAAQTISLPEQTVPLTGITAVASGGSFILALGADGAVYGWGHNSKGQLGAGILDPMVPAKIGGIDSVSAVSSCNSCNYTLAVKSDGTVWSWGDNGAPYGFIPVQVPGLEGVSRVAAGENHRLALKRDGTVWSWGANDFGQLGYEGTNSNVPQQVPWLPAVTRIAAGFNYSLALASDGTVYSWGSNRFGCLGYIGIQQTTVPLEIQGLSGVTELSGAEFRAMALRNDGSVWVWGGDDGGTGSTPVAVEGLRGVARIAAGRTHGLAILTNPSNVCSWGGNMSGELGDGTQNPRSYPGPVAGLPETKEVAAGLAYSLAVGRNGKVWSWGDNYWGQLGNGGTGISSVPTQVLQLSDIVQVTTGAYHAVALKSDGSIWGWGRNDLGQTGSNPGWLPVQALVNLAQEGVPLTVAVSGSGEGTVHSFPSGIACITGTCSCIFPPGTPLILHATASSGSLFSGWGGACSGGEDCLLQMTSNRNVSAVFSAAYPFRIGGSGYDTMLAAYSAAPAGAVIMSRDGELPGGLVADRAVAVKLAGGYYTNFSGRSGLPTRLRGKLVVRGGSMRVDRITVM